MMFIGKINDDNEDDDCDNEDEIFSFAQHKLN